LNRCCPACADALGAEPGRCAIADAIFYVLRAGCTWRLLADSLPPWRTVYRWLVRLRDGGVFEAITIIL
jgi:transposase